MPHRRHYSESAKGQNKIQVAKAQGVALKEVMNLGLRCVHHIAVKVQDLTRCTAFYHELLGLPILQHHQDDQGTPRSVWLQLGGDSILMLERTTVPERAPTGWYLLALRIQAAERTALEQDLSKQGVRISGRTPYTLYIEDPEGNRLGLSHWPELAPG